MTLWQLPVTGKKNGELTLEVPNFAVQTGSKEGAVPKNPIVIAVVISTLGHCWGCQ